MAGHVERLQQWTKQARARSALGHVRALCDIDIQGTVGDEDGENASTLVGEDAAREKMCWSVFCLTRIIQGFSLAPRPPFDSFHESIWPHHPERTTNVKRQVYGFHHNGELPRLDASRRRELDWRHMITLPRQVKPHRGNRM